MNKRIIWIGVILILIIAATTSGAIDIYDSIRAREYYLDCSANNYMILENYNGETVKIPMNEFCESLEWKFGEKEEWKVRE